MASRGQIFFFSLASCSVRLFWNPRDQGADLGTNGDKRVRIS